jgi:hypothetical protein
MAMMRHESYETILIYYAHQTAENVADAAWRAETLHQKGETPGESCEEKPLGGGGASDVSRIVKER